MARGVGELGNTECEACQAAWWVPGIGHESMQAFQSAQLVNNFTFFCGTKGKQMYELGRARESQVSPRGMG